MQLTVRPRFLELDPLLVVLAAGVTLAGLILGVGGWGMVAGALALGAGLACRVAFEAASAMRLPPPGAPERELVRRARTARRAVRGLARASLPGPVAERCRAVEPQLLSAERTIRDLARQSIAVRALGSGLEVQRLGAERERAAQRAAGCQDEQLRPELEAALCSADSRLAAGQRLGGVSSQLLARIEALTASLEAVAAELTEVVARSQTEGSSHPFIRLTQLGQEIDALRAGLDEAQSLGRETTTTQLPEERA